jgi:hypothetical protein
VPNNGGATSWGILFVHGGMLISLTTDFAAYFTSLLSFEPSSHFAQEEMK